MVALTYDILVIGGGINGCGIARDASGRGYSVLLAEMNDLASGTSSAATKLIHGGLRYLEHYEFRLVHEALLERETLWAAAPHIIWPLRLVLPHHGGLRPAWLLRLGLLIYDHLGGRRLLPPARTLDLRSDPAGEPLKESFRRAFEFSDCWVNDARLVVLAARDAADHGAVIKTRSEVVSARQNDGLWQVDLRNVRTGDVERVSARLLVNASGPWVDRVLHGPIGSGRPNTVRLVQGSHIVVRRLYEHDRCYMLQNTDGRIVFVIPYEDEFTLIGTTDREYLGDPAQVKITEGEIEYLLATVGEYFSRPLSKEDVVWSYAGVRPLYDDGASKAQEATRDYVIETIREKGEPPLINVVGGKLTTFRRLAEAVLGRIEPLLGRKRPPWTARRPLPGGDFPVTGFADAVKALSDAYPFLNAGLARRLVRLYGTRARTILGNARSSEDLGRNFGRDLYEAEVRYLVAEEWAETAEDILWRRTKRGLHGRAIDSVALSVFVAKVLEERRAQV